MTKNVGGIDKTLRLLLGAALIGATALDFLPVWGYIGIVPVATSLMGWCPLYPLFGFSSCPVKSND